MKKRLLELLRAENGLISGARLSQALGVSRVSVWKHIQKLQQNGYRISAAPRGYCLENSPDSLFPWDFGDREKQVNYFAEVTSTMDVARDMARKGCPGFTVVIAGRQTKGRGRLKRVWDSQDGGIYLTLVIRPRLAAVHAGRITFAASLCLARVLREMYAVPAMVKWPNDILVEGRKLCGMLAEMEAEAEVISFVNVGIGINANNDPTAIEPLAVTLKKLLGHEISRKELVSAFLEALEKKLHAGNLEQVIPEWKAYTSTLGKQVRIATFQETLEGQALDVDDTGALVLKLQNGTLKTVVYGDVFE